MSDDPDRLARAAPLAAAAAVTVLATAAFIVRFRFLASDPLPVGIDGHYYATQARSLLESGRLHWPSAPLTFCWMAPFAAVWGPITGVKLAAALATSLATVPAYFLVRRATEQRALAVLAAAVVASSAQSAFLSAEFIKQGVGVTLLLGFLAALPAHAHAGKWRLAALLLVATFLTHKLAFTLAVLLGAPAIIAAARADRALARWLGVLAAGAVVLTVAFALGFPGRFVALADLGLLSRSFGHPAWPRHFTLEVLAAGVASTALRVLALGQRRAPPAAVTALALLGVVVCLPWLSNHPDQLAARVRLCAFVALAVALPCALHLALARVPARARTAVPLALAALLPLALLRASTSAVVHPNPSLPRLAPALARAVPAGATVITTERAAAFAVIYHARRAATPRAPAPDSGARTFRLVPGYVIPRVNRHLPALERSLPLAIPPPIFLDPTARYAWILFPEATWQHFLQTVPTRERAALEPWPRTDLTSGR